VVLTNYASDDSPLFCSSNCAVTESCSATNYAVVTNDILFWLDDDWRFVPNEWFFQYFEDLLVDYRCFNT